MPKVSVIIPNYNHAAYLRQRLDSIFAQTYQDFEVILLDDCSTDGSQAILQEYANDSRVRLALNDKNSGSTFKQWNKGVRLARGEYIWIAESDDYADERLLQRLVPLLDADPQVAFAYCRSWQVRNGHPAGFACSQFLDVIDAERWNVDFVADGQDECRQYLVCANTVPNASAVLFRKSVYERVGGADESFRQCGDWKLWAAMAFEGKIAYVSEPLNYFRTHESSVRSTTLRTGIDTVEALQVIRWILERVTPTEKAWETLRLLASGYWPWAVVDRHVPLHVKLQVWRDAKAIDPHALRRVMSTGLTMLQLKFAKEVRLLRQRFSKVQM